MSRFLTHAEEIFETACAGSTAQDEALTILIKREGQIYIVVGENSSMDALERYDANSSAYRVSRGMHGVRVEGRSLDNRCVLEGSGAKKTGKAAAGMLGLLTNMPMYSVTPVLALAS